MKLFGLQLQNGEALLVLSGILIFISTGVIASTGLLTVWGIAKIVFVLGLVLLLLDL